MGSGSAIMAKMQDPRAFATPQLRAQFANTVGYPYHVVLSPTKVRVQYTAINNWLADHGGAFDFITDLDRLETEPLAWQQKALVVRDEYAGLRGDLPEEVARSVLYAFQDPDLAFGFKMAFG